MCKTKMGFSKNWYFITYCIFSHSKLKSYPVPLDCSSVVFQTSLLLLLSLIFILSIFCSKTLSHTIGLEIIYRLLVICTIKIGLHLPLCKYVCNWHVTVHKIYGLVCTSDLSHSSVKFWYSTGEKSEINSKQNQQNCCASQSNTAVFHYWMK